jgi:hypothetical protein
MYIYIYKYMYPVYWAEPVQLQGSLRIFQDLSGLALPGCARARERLVSISRMEISSVSCILYMRDIKDTIARQANVSMHVNLCVKLVS